MADYTIGKMVFSETALLFRRIAMRTVNKHVTQKRKLCELFIAVIWRHKAECACVDEHSSKLRAEEK